MNIFNNPNVQRLTRIFQTDNEPKNDKVSAASGAQKSSKSDSVNLSSEGKTLSAIKQRLAETPDVRHEKIAALKDAIANGTYHVSAEDIAEAMMKEGKLP